MKVQYYSNLSHLLRKSVLPKPAAPILILLGDIINPFNPDTNKFLNYVSHNWKKTVWIPGREEVVHNDISYEEAIYYMNEICPHNIKILSNKYYDLGDTVILGSTLLSSEFKNMKIYPKGHSTRKYPLIEELNSLILKDHYWLQGLLDELKEHQVFKRIIVATYTAPLAFSNEILNHKYNNYSHLYKLNRYSPDYWLVGNTEKNMTCYMYDNKNKIVRFASNSVKYGQNFGREFGEKLNFDGV